MILPITHLFASLAITASAAAQLPASLLVNPSFESSCTNPLDVLSSGSTSIPGWTTTGPVDWICSYWPAADGTRSVDLNACGPGGVSQSFATVSGHAYTVTFALAGNPGTPSDTQGPAQKMVSVSAASQSEVFIFDTTGYDNSNLGWRRKTWSFVANSAVTTISLQSIVPNCQGPVVDIVEVRPYTSQACFGSLHLRATGDLGFGGTLDLQLAGMTGIPCLSFGFPPNTPLPAPCACPVLTDGGSGLGFFFVGATASLLVPNAPSSLGLVVELQGADVLPSNGGCTLAGIPLALSGILSLVLD